MSIQATTLKRDRDILLMVNHKLEQMYSVQKSPCLALHISKKLLFTTCSTFQN